MDNKKPIRFSKAVPPGESVTLTRTVDEPATIEHLAVRFYTGPELAVHVTPRRIPENGDGQPQDLVELEGKDHIDGDGDHWQFEMSESVEKEDVLEVEIINTASPDPELDLTYDVTVDVSLDREGGVLRPVRSLIDDVRGWI